MILESNPGKTEKISVCKVKKNNEVNFYG